MFEYHVFVECGLLNKKGIKVVGDALLHTARMVFVKDGIRDPGIRVVGMEEGQLQVYDEQTKCYTGDEDEGR